MADRTFDAAETLTAFRESAHWWRSLVGGVDDHQWDLMALGEWTARTLGLALPQMRAGLIAVLA